MNYLPHKGRMQPAQLVSQTNVNLRRLFDLTLWRLFSDLMFWTSEHINIDMEQDVKILNLEKVCIVQR